LTRRPTGVVCECRWPALLSARSPRRGPFIDPLRSSLGVRGQRLLRRAGPLRAKCFPRARWGPCQTGASRTCGVPRCQRTVPSCRFLVALLQRAATLGVRSSLLSLRGAPFGLGGRHRTRCRHRHSRNACLYGRTSWVVTPPYPRDGGFGAGARANRSSTHVAGGAPALKISTDSPRCPPRRSPWA